MAPPIALGLRGLGVGSGKAYFQKVLATGPIAFWPLWEQSGSVAHCLVNPAQNGTYVGVTTGDALGPDGLPAPWFAGSTGYVNILTSAFSSAFNTAEGTAAIWCRVNAAGVWTDGTTRRALTVRTDGANQVQLTKNNVNNQLFFQYIAGGDSELWTPAYSSTAWFHLAITWSVSGNRARAFINGAQSGADSVGLGAWVGALDNATISSLAGGGNFWHGWLARPAVWDEEKAPSVIASLAQI